LTEVLLAHQALQAGARAQGRKLELLVVAPERVILKTQVPLGILPTHSFSELESQPIDGIWIPTLMDPENPEVQKFLRNRLERANGPRILVTSGEGLQVLARATKLVSEKPYPVHFSSIPNLAPLGLRLYSPPLSGPQVENMGPLPEFPKVAHLMVPGGVTSVEGALETLTYLAGSPSLDQKENLTQALKEQLGHELLPEDPVSRSLPSSHSPALETWDYLALLFRAGFDWNSKREFLQLEEGFPDLELLRLELSARSLTEKMSTVSIERTPKRTRGGLWVLAQESIEQAGFPNRWLLPRRGIENSGSKLEDWLASQKIPTQILDESPTGSVPASLLRELRERHGAHLASMTENLMLFPESSWTRNTRSEVLHAPKFFRTPGLMLRFLLLVAIGGYLGGLAAKFLQRPQGLR
jgi:hypothetical protein